jgi:hypothetical protein
MNLILRAFPHGQVREVHAPDNNELLYYEILIAR